MLLVHVKQQVSFVDGSELQDLENVKETELTAFFKLNEMLKAENASINQMPMYVVSPATGDLYYL